MGYDQVMVRSTGDMSYSSALENMFIVAERIQVLVGTERYSAPSWGRVMSLGGVLFWKK